MAILANNSLDLHPTNTDMNLLMGVASQTAVSINNAQSFQQVQERKKSTATSLRMRIALLCEAILIVIIVFM
jgi:GAF domain-containing protein